MTRCNQQWAWAVGCLCWLAGAWAGAVDLRTEIQGQSVIRRVHYQWESDEPAIVEEMPELLTPEAVFSDPAPMHGGCDIGYADGGCASGGCAAGCSTCTLCCGPWASVEFINWWRDASWAPPLVTSGLLPTSTVLYGDERIFDHSRTGLRIAAGTPLGPCCPWQIMGRYYVLDELEEHFQAESDGGSLLARPFYNLSLDASNQLIGNDALLISDGVPGQVAVWGVSNVQGGDVLAGLSLGQACRSRTLLLLGYSTAEINETLVIRSRTQQPNVVLSAFDRFEVSNEFHGATLGVQHQACFTCASIELLGKVSFGNMRQQAFLDGGSTGNPNAGLLIQQSNEGFYEQDMFAVAPELGVNLVYQPSACVGVVVGYSFLYWNSVSQSGDLIDPLLRVNPNDPAPPGEFPQPDFEFRHQDFWVHGLNVGLRICF